MALKCVQRRCSTQNALPNIEKQGFFKITSFYINLWKGENGD